jgi:hypothetical protein
MLIRKIADTVDVTDVASAVDLDSIRLSALP